MLEFGVAVKAIIFNTKLGKYLVLQKSDFEDINPNDFDIPGGRIKFGEKLEEAVVRETREETGLKVKPIAVFNAWTFIKEEKNFQLTGIDFLCFTNQEKVKLSKEHAGFWWENAAKTINNKKYPAWLGKTIEKAEKIRRFY